MTSSTAFSSPRSPVLILGGNSRIGRLLGRVWKSGEAHGLSPLWQMRQALDQDSVPAPQIILDILADPDALAQAAEGCATILVLAGVTPAPGRDQDAYHANTTLAQAAIQAAARAGVARVLLTSSSAVYGTAVAGPHGHAETGSVAPQNDYGLAKLHMEHSALAAPPDNVEVCALRIGNVAGADQLLGPGRRDITLDVFEDGRGPCRSYLSPHALARILADLIRHHGPLPSLLNVSAPGTVDMAALLRAAEIPFTPRPAPDTLLAQVPLDVRRLEALVPLLPTDSAPDRIVRDWLSVTNGKSLT